MPSHGGNDCAGLDGGSTTKTESCKIKECPIDGTWSQYGAWSSCSATCGPGTQTKTRTCDGKAHGGNDCVGSASKVGNCNLGSCVTYSWSKTAASCPTACGTAASSPADSYDCVGSDGSTGNAGSLCVTKPSTTTSCAATSPCPVHGSWSGWTAGACITTTTVNGGYCGSGTKVSTRTCENQAHGGNDCVGSTSKSE